MTTYISLLRGVNVGGQNKIDMQALRSLYAALGLADVRSYVQSGNVLFASAEQESSLLARRIEARVERSFGAAVTVFVRTPDDFRRILAANPFLKRNEDPTRLHVTFLSTPLPTVKLGLLAGAATAGDEFSPGEAEIYLFCPNGYGRTKLSNAFFERKLGLAATTRNWNTVTTLYNLAVEGMK